jgi:hypothetical protein
MKDMAKNTMDMAGTVFAKATTDMESSLAAF